MNNENQIPETSAVEELGSEKPKNAFSADEADATLLQPLPSAPETKKNKHNDVITIIVCVLCAFCIWCYVMSVDSPASEQTFSMVSVGVENKNSDSGENNFTAISGDGSVIEVTLKGRKTVLNALSDNDINAYVDVSGVTSAGKNAYPVVVEAPRGTTVVSYTPQEVTMYVDKNGSKQVDVEVALTDYTLSSGYSFGTAKPSYNKITVSGPQTELDQIDHAQLTLRPGEVSASFTGSGDLALVDSAGNVILSKYLTLSVSNISCEVPVCIQKSVHLTTDFKNGYLSAATSTVTISPPEVAIRGPVETLQKLTTLNVATLDETTIQEQKSYTYALTLPEGVELCNEGDSNISVTMTLRGVSSKTITVSDFSLANVPSDKKVTILTKSMNVLVYGNADIISTITADDISVTVDISNNESIASGSQAANVRIKGGNSSVSYVNGVYSVDINVR